MGNRGDHGGLITPLWGEKNAMQIRKIIQRRIRRSAGGVDVIGDVNAAISGNVGESSSQSHVTSRSSVSAKSVQRSKGGDRDSAETQP